MSLNETLPTVTPTSLLFENIPIQTIAVALTLIVLAVALISAMLYIYSKNQGKKTIIKVWQSPDKSIAIRYYYHDIGHSFYRRCESVEEAQKFINKMLEGAFN